MNIDELIHYMMKGEQRTQIFSPVSPHFSLLILSIIVTGHVVDIINKVLIDTAIV
jgi:uncharacterized membrane protein (DUF106 family)